MTTTTTDPGNVKAAGGLRLHVLLVEDDWLVRTTLTEMLQHHGHEVKEASDGPRALDLLAEGHVDLLITDVTLPGMSGIDLAARARLGHPGLAVIFATGHAHAEGVVTDERSGVLLKPFGSDALRAEVSRLFSPPAGRYETLA